MLERARRQTIEQQGVCHAGFCAVPSGQAAASVVMLRQNLPAVTKQNNRCRRRVRVDVPCRDAVYYEGIAMAMRSFLYLSRPSHYLVQSSGTR